MLRGICIFIRNRTFLVTQNRQPAEVVIRGFENFEFVCGSNSFETSDILEQGLPMLDRECLDNLPEPSNFLVQIFTVILCDIVRPKTIKESGLNIG